MKPALPSGLPLTARPPLHQFTQAGYKHVWTCAGVYLFDMEGEPHWFATDGYSAMLTPAVHTEEAGADMLFGVSVGKHRAYRADHIRDLFKYVKGRHILLEASTGILHSPDGIMHVPPYEHDAPEGEEPEPVPLPDVHKPFKGVMTEQSECALGLQFVHAIRGAFNHLTKDAELVMSFLADNRLLFDIHAPYRAQIVLATKKHDPVKPEDTQDEDAPADAEGTDSKPEGKKGKDKPSGPQLFTLEELLGEDEGDTPPTEDGEPA